MAFPPARGSTAHRVIRAGTPGGQGRQWRGPPWRSLLRVAAPPPGAVSGLQRCRLAPGCVSLHRRCSPQPPAQSAEPHGQGKTIIHDSGYPVQTPDFEMLVRCGHSSFVSVRTSERLLGSNQILAEGAQLHCHLSNHAHTWLAHEEGAVAQAGEECAVQRPVLADAVHQHEHEAAAHAVQRRPVPDQAHTCVVLPGLTEPCGHAWHPRNRILLHIVCLLLLHPWVSAGSGVNRPAYFKHAKTCSPSPNNAGLHALASVFACFKKHIVMAARSASAQGVGRGSKSAPAVGALGGGLQRGRVAQQAARQHDLTLIEHAVHCVLQLHQVGAADGVRRGQPAPEQAPRFMLQPYLAMSAPTGTSPLFVMMGQLLNLSDNLCQCSSACMPDAPRRAPRWCGLMWPGACRCMYPAAQHMRTRSPCLQCGLSRDSLFEQTLFWSH